MLIGSSKKFRHTSKQELDLFLDDSKLNMVTDEKILRILIDKNLSWLYIIDYLIKKLYSRVCFLKRALSEITSHYYVHCRDLLYNSLPSSSLF
jgi:hypothetical protein